MTKKKNKSRVTQGRKSSGYIGVDLDKTLAYYEKGDFKKYGEFHIGEPIEPMCKIIREHIAAGDTVRVFTARMAESSDISRLQKVIRDWTKEHLGEPLQATCKKDRHMWMLYDDRAIGVVANTGILVTQALEEEISKFRGTKRPVDYGWLWQEDSCPINPEIPLNKPK